MYYCNIKCGFCCFSLLLQCFLFQCCRKWFKGTVVKKGNSSTWLKENPCMLLKWYVEAWERKRERERRDSLFLARTLSMIARKVTRGIGHYCLIRIIWFRIRIVKKNYSEHLNQLVQIQKRRMSEMAPRWKCRASDMSFALRPILKKVFRSNHSDTQVSHWGH